MTNLYPLRFAPLYRHYLWGGRRFETLLGRVLDPDPEKVYAESWEVVDRGDDQSVVAAGPLAGATLGRLVAECREALLGPGRPAAATGPAVARRFPLIMKFLDAAKNLSLQVHPDDEMAARLDPPDLGKTEAWFVLAAEPGSRIYAGLKPGVDRDALRAASLDGNTDQCVAWFEPTPGDCLFIPAGMVHGLGRGIVVAEIQQASDTTFRLFDWNRLGPDGRPRELHVERALEAIDFAAGAPGPIRVESGEPNRLVPIVTCEYFVMSRCDLAGEASMAGDGHCHLLAVLEGSVEVEGDAAETPLTRGQTILLPAALPAVAIRSPGGATVLDVQVR
ncbi:MAG TPA: mannose-6-phosphate isomerase [Planctomycetaceae bacterium]|nr:mannose-6-phosphate isomerase [Planctomycetaceae bacterium]